MIKIGRIKNIEVIWITFTVMLITAGHYFLAPHFGILHNILQRLYYIPIIWAAYRYGRNGGLLVSVICGILYLPHILISWGSHVEYQTTQIIEIILYIIIGYSAGILFEQKVSNQKLLRSYEKMAVFGSLSRSIIKSLKAPIKSIKGMLIAFESVAQREPAAKTFLSVVKEEISVIENVRNDLIALVERKKLRLKKQNLNKVLFDFTTEIETSLRYKNIHLIKKISDLKLQVYVNKVAINNALHHLVSAIVEKKNPAQVLQLSVEETSSYAMIGGTVQDSILVSYYQSDLSALNSTHYHEYDLIDVINIMNNHFGDAKFRWLDNQLVEFILVFPKKLKLPWYLKDEPVTSKVRKSKKSDKSKRGRIINV